MKKKKKKPAFKKVKKQLKDFMLDEEGFASKEKMLKLGIGTVVALGLFSELYHDVAFAQHNPHTSHHSSKLFRSQHQSGHSSNHSAHSSY